VDARVSLSVPVDPGPMGLDLGKGGNGKVEPSVAHGAAVVLLFFVFACEYVLALCMGFVYGLVTCCGNGLIVCCLLFWMWMKWMKCLLFGGDGLLEVREGRRECRVFKVQDS
jgi:hypothetical protein